ncbi:MAG: hypothetical protein ACNA8H_05640 [Anaerolineales bacterium]
MKNRKIMIILLGCILLIGSVGSAMALSSIEMLKDSTQGAGSGGFTAGSGTYLLATSMGGTIQISSQSGSYTLCSGFLCGGDQFFSIPEPPPSEWFVYLPMALHSSP